MTTEPTISDIYYKLGGLESKIDSVLATQKADNERHKGRLDSHDERIGRLERVEAKRTGMLVVVASLFSIVSAILVKFISTQLHLS